jgi:N-acetylmuramoyl-L-alanine amidase
VITLLSLRPYICDVVAPSPNHGTRRAQTIEGIVLHATEDAGNEARSLNWLRSRKSRASCHLFVSRVGGVTRLVGDQQRAWHAGAARWRGKSDVNSITLGIEIANRNDGEPFTDAQYARVASIVAHYCRQGISLDDVVGHSEIAPRRRSDPRGWDWDRFRAMVEYQLLPAAIPAQQTPSVREPSGMLASSAMPYQRARTTTSPKPVFRSRILWLNGLTVLAAGVAILAETLELAFRVGFTIPEEVTTWALFAVGVVNIILRFRTTRPLDCNQVPAPAPADAVPMTLPRTPALLTSLKRKQASTKAPRAVQSNRQRLPNYG